MLFQKRVFPYYIWILIIYCSFEKGGEAGQIGGVMMFNATFNYISVISWLSCFIGENHLHAASLTTFINNVSSNKGVLIADIYIRTTVYINLKNTSPSKPQSKEIRPSFSVLDFSRGPVAHGQ